MKTLRFGIEIETVGQTRETLARAIQAVVGDFHGLNTLDTSSYNIIVGAAAGTGSPPVRRFAICFRCDINFHPTGSCATGWPANFFTDNSQFGFTCNPAITPQRTSIMEIQGQGWRDAALATVSGVPLCPIYYSGIWCIRCCSEDAFPASYTTFGAGCPSALGVSHRTDEAITARCAGERRI